MDYIYNTTFQSIVSAKVRWFSAICILLIQSVYIRWWISGISLLEGITCTDSSAYIHWLNQWYTYSWKSANFHWFRFREYMYECCRFFCRRLNLQIVIDKLMKFVGLICTNISKRAKKFSENQQKKSDFPGYFTFESALLIWKAHMLRG